MSTTLPWPMRTRQLMRLGRPKEKSSSCITESPLTWPTSEPSVRMTRVWRRISSWMRSRNLSERWILASMARCTWRALTTLERARRAQ